VEDSGVGNAFIDGFVIPNGQTSISPNLYSRILPQTFVSVKPLYAWFGHYIASSMHCQAHLCQTFVSKISEFAQKIKKTFIKIYKGLINI